MALEANDVFLNRRDNRVGGLVTWVVSKTKSFSFFHIFPFPFIFSFLVFPNHRLIRRDRPVKYCVFTKELTKIPFSFCFAARSLLLTLGKWGWFFSGLQYINKKYSACTCTATVQCTWVAESTQYQTHPHRRRI